MVEYGRGVNFGRHGDLQGPKCDFGNGWHFGDRTFGNTNGKSVQGIEWRFRKHKGSGGYRKTRSGEVTDYKSPRGPLVVLYGGMVVA